MDITLTSRDKNSENPVPLAGVPYHAVQGYLSRLVDKGYKVAIVEQVEDPKQAKGMVKREVVRIVTPGLVMDGDNLAADENNFLVSIFGHEKRFGLALLDISTGEFRCTELNDEAELSNEMVKLTPREILFPDAWRDSEEIARWLPWNARPLIDYRADVEFDARRAEELLCRQFQTSNLKGFGVDGLPLALRAAGALMSYVQETQRQRAEHITALTPYSSKEFMVLDEATKVNLELERTILDGRKRGSLLGILDRCRTPVGSRTLKRWLNYPADGRPPVSANVTTLWKNSFYMAPFARRDSGTSGPRGRSLPLVGTHHDGAWQRPRPCHLERSACKPAPN